MASTSSSVKPHNPTQSSSVIIFALKPARRVSFDHLIGKGERARQNCKAGDYTPYHTVERALCFASRRKESLMSEKGQQ